MPPVFTSSSVPPIAARQAGEDAGEDDHRDAVADAALGDLLAEPHQEHRAGDERDGGGAVTNAGPGFSTTPCVCSATRGGDRLERREQHGAVARVLRDLAAAGLAFLAQLLRAPGSRACPAAQ